MTTTTKNPAKPYQNEALNTVYELLFCDKPAVYRQKVQSTDYPWDTLLAEAPDVKQLTAIASDSSLEDRQRLLAYHLLSVNGSPSTHHELFGVIIEVDLPGGLDVVAAFRDGTARYINHSERLLVWETRTDESNRLINQLFAHSQQVVNRIGRWDGERRPFPTNGTIRLNFLVSDGLYFGEGPFNTLYTDPMGGPVINSAIQLMDYLTRTATTNQN